MLKLKKNNVEYEMKSYGGNNMATYKELYLAGEIEFEEIDDYSFEWGISDDERTLAQYLGLNADEEDALKELLDQQRCK